METTGVKKTNGGASGAAGDEEVEDERPWPPERLREFAMKTHGATSQTAAPDVFPKLDTMPSGLLYRFVARPAEPEPAEYLYVPVPPHSAGDEFHRVNLLLTMWNALWESGSLRVRMLDNEIPDSLASLRETEGSNVTLLPSASRSVTAGERLVARYDALATLYHLLPRRVLERRGLPLLSSGRWPYWCSHHLLQHLLPVDFEARLGQAFADHLWPLLGRTSSMDAFARNDPVRLLAHNLDFWLPYANRVADERLSADEYRCEPESDQEAAELERVRREAPEGVIVDMPRLAGPVWEGEADAWAATHEIVAAADADGRLARILDAVRSHRVEEDFSARWSHAREDFERRLYRKRSKVRVSFVELRDTLPVHGPESEVHDDLLFEDFLALLDERERHIVVLLRSGPTTLAQVAEQLGYANHSPVSKKLARIRRKASRLLDH